MPLSIFEVNKIELLIPFIVLDTTQESGVPIPKETLPLTKLTPPSLLFSYNKCEFSTWKGPPRELEAEKSANPWPHVQWVLLSQ